MEPNRTMDYGKGFYTTTSKEQADKWVARKIANAGLSKGYANVYSFDESGYFAHDYDLVYGPVANDRVYAAFALYEEGMLNKAGLIEELRAYKLANQLLFHNTKALLFLHFENAEEISK